MNKDISHNSKESIVMIGAGHVATNMARAFFKKGYIISGIYSRKIENAQLLAQKTRSRAFESVEELPANASLYIISVADDAIEKLAGKFKHVRGMVVHTSGSTSINVFKGQFAHYGVLYPLQTFNKEKPLDFNAIPLFIEASDKPAGKFLYQLATSLSGKVIELSSVERIKMHVAAVFACNFSQHMATMAAKLMKETGIDYSMLFPLIKQTTEKMMTDNPAEYQTGPAVRNDEKTILKHIDLLADDEKMMKLYSFVSDHINNFHNSSG